MSDQLNVPSVALASGLVLPYAEQGDPSGITLVLVHAIADSWRIFAPVLAALPASIHVLVPTQRGHGEASKPETGYRSSDYAADLLEFLDALSVDSAVIAGASSGGLIAQRFAIDHPERTLGLALLGAPLRLGDKELARRFGDTIAQLSDPIDPAFVRALNEQIAQHVARDVLATIMAENLKAPARVWQQTYEGALDDDFSGELARITAPALVVWGDRDTLLTRDEEETLARTIPNARLLVYEGIGHLVYVEQPARVAHDLAAFSDGLGPHEAPGA